MPIEQGPRNKVDGPVGVEWIKDSDRWPLYVQDEKSAEVVGSTIASGTDLLLIHAKTVDIATNGALILTRFNAARLFGILAVMLDAEVPARILKQIKLGGDTP